VSDVVQVSDADLFTSQWTTDMVYLPFIIPYGPATGDVFALLESTPDSGAVRVACSGASPYGTSALLKGIAESIQWTSRTPLVRLAFSTPETGIAETPANAGALTVFPSPADRMIWIDLPAGRSPQRGLQVFSVSGIQVIQRPVEVAGGRIALDIGTLGPGLYAVQLQGADRTYSGRFLVVR
jgi:hypothetical protein